MYTTWEFYNEVYLFNSPPLIQENLFPKYAQRAWERINKWNLEFDDDWVIPIYIEMSICGVAELLYLSSTTQEQRMAGVRSYSNDGYSVSFGETATMELEINIRNVISKYIAFTPYHNQFVSSAVNVR